MRRYFHRTLIIALCIMQSILCNACGNDEPGATEKPTVPETPVTPPSTDPDTDKHFAGVWITNVASDALSSPAKVKETVDLCSKCGITDMFVVVWNKAMTMYPSQVMKNLTGKEISDGYEGRDPLAEIIAEGHRQGLKVHAWFEYGFATSNNAGGGPILAAKPGWAAKDSNGNLLIKNGFEWMNAFHPEVQDFMLSLVMEVVDNYDVDGIQGDDRMPALPSTGGYDDYTRKLYRDTHDGKEPPADYKNADWIAWRANLLSDFQERLYKEVKKHKPDVIVSCAPSIHPWAKDEYLQDWPEWFKRGCADMILPQHYRYNIDAYEQVLTQQVSYLQAKDRGKFFPGILIRNGNYSPDETFLRKMIESNRRRGITGESFWFFEGLKQFPEFFSGYQSM